jgi:hypothetical protein
MQYYAIEFVSDLRQWFSPVSSTIKIDRHYIAEILLEMALKKHSPNPNHNPPSWKIRDNKMQNNIISYSSRRMTYRKGKSVQTKSLMHLI